MKVKAPLIFLPIAFGVAFTVFLFTFSEVMGSDIPSAFNPASSTQPVYLPLITAPPMPPLMGAAIGYTGVYNEATYGPQQYFPSFRKDNLGWNSTIAIQNMTNQLTTLTIAFLHQNGSIAYTKNNISLQPFATYIASAKDFPSLASGYFAVVATASENIAGMVNDLDSTGAMGIGYNGASQGGQQIVIPILFKNYFDQTSRYCLQNTESTIANITIRYFDKSNEIATHFVDLTVNGSTCISTADESYLPSGFVGAATITASADIVVFTEDIRLTEGLARGYLGFNLDSSSNTVYLPQCRKLNGWQTLASLTNVGPVYTDVSASFRSADGKTVKSFIVSDNLYPSLNGTCHSNPYLIPPPWPTDDNYLGSAVLSSTAASPIIALVSEINVSENTDIFSYPGLENSSTVVYLPNVGNGLNFWNSSLSIQNVDPITNNISIKFYNQTGVLVHELLAELPPYSMEVYEIAQIPDLGSSFNGSAIISTAHPISALISKER